MPDNGHVADANESFERAAEAFRRATGYLAPGKHSIFSCSEDEVDRQRLWRVWCAAVEYTNKENNHA